MQPILVIVGAVLFAGLATVLFLQLQRRRMHARELYQHHLEDALADGVLSEEEAEELASLREEKALTEAEVRMVALSIYRRALQNAISDSRVTANEDATLRRLQKLLGLEDADLRDDRQQMQRVHVFARIERGELPRVAAPVELEGAEICHWVVQARLAQRLTIPGPPRPPLVSLQFTVDDATPFHVSGTRDALKPAEEVLPLDLGMLLVTNRRTLFRGARRTSSLPHIKLNSIRLFHDGLLLDSSDGQPVLFLVDDAELTAAVLLTAARARRHDLGRAGRTA
ncbi:MAG TPA: hypothetical protein VK864_04445 [Longimicrobiales bacterium]|nr:hypothetical protein [Longimicrobiales bacterium]